MYLLKSHDIVRYAGCVCLLLSCFYTFSQCPTTQSILLPLESNGQAHAQAIDFFQNPSEVITTALNREVYGCTTVGIQEITLDIIDRHNNPQTCKEFIVISDPTGYCKDEPHLPTAILGKIITPIGQPVQGVTVSVTNSTASVFRGTNEDGLYLFDDIPESNYILSPAKNNDLKNGVTTQDIILLQKHLIKIKPFDSPYQYVAADVNNSGDITAFDMILLRQTILNSIDHFPNNTSWKFVKAEFQFSGAANALTETLDLDPTYDIDYAPSLSMNNNFVGIKIGDLNNSVFANMIMMPRHNNRFDISLDNPSFEANEIIKLPFKSTQELKIEGFQAAINLGSSLELLDIEGLADYDYHVVDQQLFISKSIAEGLSVVEVEPLFSLVFRAKTKGNLKDQLHFDNRTFQNELYTGEGSLPLHFSFPKNTSTTTIGNNYPNPFASTTSLPLTLSTAADIQVTVYNLQGQAIWQQSQSLDSGVHHLPITASFTANGVYLYELLVEGETYSGKLNYQAN